MKYTSDVAGKSRDVDITGDESALTIAAETTETGVLERFSGDRYVLRIGSRAIEGHVVPTDDGYLVVLQGRTYPVTVTDERSRTLQQLGGAKHKQAGGAIKAPMPGLVKAVNVAPGAAVERGTSLVILEAMKMENDLTAPGPGAVKEVRVAAGDKVDQGQVLVVIE